MTDTPDRSPWRPFLCGGLAAVWVFLGALALQDLWPEGGSPDPSEKSAAWLVGAVCGLAATVSLVGAVLTARRD